MHPPELRPDDALLLDFDGTLVPIAPTPEGVRPREDLVPTLRRLHASLHGAVAIVTGRPIGDLDRFLAPLRLPAVGVHGFEWRHADTIERLALPPSIGDARAALEEVARLDPRLRLEDKVGTIALHWRQAPEHAEACVAAARGAVAAHPELRSIVGKAVVEVRPEGVDKGVGIERLLARTPFSGRRPWYVGDDTTDEDAFPIVDALGGVSVKIGEGPTCARYRLPDPDALIDRLCAALPTLAG
jgi:trehalose 6-phosphate phosphatase